MPKNRQALRPRARGHVNEMPFWLTYHTRVDNNVSFVSLIFSTIRINNPTRHITTSRLVAFYDKP